MARLPMRLRAMKASRSGVGSGMSIIATTTMIPIAMK